MKEILKMLNDEPATTEQTPKDVSKDMKPEEKPAEKKEAMVEEKQV